MSDAPESGQGRGDHSPALPTTLDSVLGALDEIIEDSIETNSALGYFAALYRRVTQDVAIGIETGMFQDGKRMERLDVLFANRYLAAYDAFHQGESVTGSWLAAFGAEDHRSLGVLQHLLLGMNAHINLDLGIAASEVAGGRPMALKADFMQINEILRRQINDTQNRIARFVRALRLVDRLLGSIDEQLSMFSISYARGKAWTQTLELCASDPGSRAALIRQRDEAVSGFARKLIRPRGFLVRLSLLLLRMFERGATAQKVRQLAAD
jgi:hypothetical protein